MTALATQICSGCLLRFERTQLLKRSNRYYCPACIKRRKQALKKLHRTEPKR